MHWQGYRLDNFVFWLNQLLLALFPKGLVAGIDNLITLSDIEKLSLNKDVLSEKIYLSTCFIKL